MIVIGLDPGIDRLGWAVLSDESEGISLKQFGLITTDKTAESAIRLSEIHRDVTELFVTFHPDAVYVESLFFSVNVKTAMIVSEVRGVIKAAGGILGYSMHEIHPMTLKKRIVGTAKANKKEMQKAISSLFSLEEKFKTDDVADAIAIGYVGLLEAIGQL